MKKKFDFNELLDRGACMVISILVISYLAGKLISIGDINAFEIIVLVAFIIYSVITFFYTSND